MAKRGLGPISNNTFVVCVSADRLSDLMFAKMFHRFIVMTCRCFAQKNGDMAISCSIMGKNDSSL